MKTGFRRADSVLRIKKAMEYGVSIAVAEGDETAVYCSGSGRFGQDYPVNPDMLFQAGSVSKPVFALTLLRFADQGIIDLDADISGVLPDLAGSPLTFAALLSHTAGLNVHGFGGYRAGHRLLTLEDVTLGRGNSPRIRQTMPYGKQYCYSGGGIMLAELAFTRITGMTLRDAFAKEVAGPLGLSRIGFFQPLDENMADNVAFGGRLGEKEDRAHGYHYYPEHAAAGLWTTPSELARIGIALGRSFRDGGLLTKESARRMASPVMHGYGLCLDCGKQDAGHNGWNEGFLTYWRFSLKEDLCAAVMVNRDDGRTRKRLAGFAAGLFRNAGG